MQMRSRPAEGKLVLHSALAPATAGGGPWVVVVAVNAGRDHEKVPRCRRPFVSILSSFALASTSFDAERESRWDHDGDLAQVSRPQHRPPTSAQPCS